MARQIHTLQSHSNADPADLASLGTQFNLTLVAADTTNKETFPTFSGVEAILAYNSGTTPHTITVDGVKVKGRAGSITAYSLAAGQIALIALPTDGWRQTDGSLHFEANHAEVKFAVIKHT